MSTYAFPKASTFIKIAELNMEHVEDTLSHVILNCETHFGKNLCHYELGQSAIWTISIASWLFLLWVFYRSWYSVELSPVPNKPPRPEPVKLDEFHSCMKELSSVGSQCRGVADLINDLTERLRKEQEIRQ